jgi:hypothetical protein
MKMEAYKQFDENGWNVLVRNDYFEYSKGTTRIRFNYKDKTVVVGDKNWGYYKAPAMNLETLKMIVAQAEEMGW